MDEQGAAAALAAALVCAPARSVQVDLGLVDQVYSVAITFANGPTGAAVGAAADAPAAGRAPSGDASDLEDDLTPATARLEVGWTLLRALALAAAGAAAVRPHIDAILGAMKPMFTVPKKVCSARAVCRGRAVKGPLTDGDPRRPAVCDCAWTPLYGGGTVGAFFSGRPRRSV